MLVGHNRFKNTRLARYGEAVAADNLGSELEAAITSISRAGDYTVGGEVPLCYNADYPVGSTPL